MKIVIGIDPDSNKHGVAVYRDGKLESLRNCQLVEIMQLIQCCEGEDLKVSIEDVCANNSMFHHAKTKAAEASIGRRIGKVQQSQIELERLFEWLDVPVIKNKISKSWKSQAGKKQFEQVTGWTGRSNEDTRSAAYFGWLHAVQDN